MSITFPVSRGLDIAAEKVKQSARIRELKKPRVVAELEPGGVNIQFVPP